MIVAPAKTSEAIIALLNSEARTIFSDATHGISMWLGLAGEEFRIGSSSLSFFNGSIDDVRIYNRALTPSEIQSVYSAPAPGTLALFAIGIAGLGFKRGRWL